MNLYAYLLVHVYPEDTEIATGLNPALPNPEIDQNDCALFPNLTSSDFRIQCKEFHSGTLSVYNSIGQDIFQEKLTSNVSMVDISDFSQGIYLVKIIDDDGQIRFSGKIVKE